MVIYTKTEMNMDMEYSIPIEPGIRADTDNLL